MPCRISLRARRFCRIALLAVCTSCRQDMADQPRYDPYQESTFFSDSLSARPLPEGVVARSSSDPGQPPATTLELLQRGRQRFDIYCAPCHGFTGAGDGVVAVRGLRTVPPTLHSERLRGVDAAYLYDVILNGFGAMPSYAYQVQASDRWAIVAYIRALQLSQWADISAVPADERAKLEGVPQ